MQPTELSKSIEHFIGQLSDHQRIKLLEFLESMTSEKIKTTTDLSKHAGSIDQHDHELMEQAIAEGCEKNDTLL